MSEETEYIRCSAKTKANTDCKRKAQKDSIYCYCHQSEMSRKPRNSPKSDIITGENWTYDLKSKNLLYTGIWRCDNPEVDDNELDEKFSSKVISEIDYYKKNDFSIESVVFSPKSKYNLKSYVLYTLKTSQDPQLIIDELRKLLECEEGFPYRENNVYLF